MTGQPYRGLVYIVCTGQLNTALTLQDPKQQQQETAWILLLHLPACFLVLCSGVLCNTTSSCWQQGC